MFKPVESYVGDLMDL